MNFSDITKFSNQKLDFKNNAFDFVRLFLSLMVVFSHSLWIGFGKLEFTIPAKDMQAQVDFGQIAVYGFFAISGFLIANSWIRSSGIVDFIQKRIFRLFPAFWVCIFISAAFFAPLYFVLSGKTIVTYFSVNGLNSYRYFWTNILLEIRQENIGNTLDLVFRKITNGPLWSLIFEFRAYILLAILGVLGIFKNKFLIILPFLFF